MITRRFIERAHCCFDELNYHETESLDFDAFQKSCVNTLNRTVELSDAIETVKMIRFCLKYWNKIERVFKRKLEKWNEYEYEGSALISTRPVKDSYGAYFITNGINKCVEDVLLSSSSFEDEIYLRYLENDVFSVFDDGEYYIKYSRLSSCKMKLFDQHKHCLCNIVLSEKFGIFLENNSTPYELVVYDEAVGIYEREYIESLADTDEIDPHKLVAMIEWDIMDENSELGLAKMSLYLPNQDLEMLLLFAVSTFLVYQRYKKHEEKKRSGVRAGVTAGVVYSLGKYR